jgi:glycosyltransferase involved in cell wall biosynthesis
MAASTAISTAPSSTEKIRVMRLIARLNVGGPAIHTTLLTEQLDPQRFQSQLVTGKEGENEGHMWDLMGHRDWQPTVIPSLGREISPKNDWRTLQEVVRLMRKEQPQIVHTHTAKAGFVGRMAARLCRVPIIVHTYHGNVFKGYFSPKKTQLFIKIERLLSTFTDRIIVLGEQQKQEILSLGIGLEKQYRIIPLGLDLAPFLQAETLRGELRSELNIAPDVPLVGIVARLVPIKAIDVLLRAVPKVLQASPQTQFLIVGDGELRGELEALAKQLNIQNSVHFLGFRSDLVRVNADLDCKVLCSLNEGLPVAVIEALAAARPVVATDVGSVKDLVVPQQSGVLVPSGDADALASGIIEVLSDAERAARWGLAGRERVYPQLDISRLVRDVENLYLDLLREKGIIKH